MSKLYGFDKDGRRKALSGKRFVVELEDGNRIEIDLDAHPQGMISLHAHSHVPGEPALLQLCPGAANVVHVGLASLPRMGDMAVVSEMEALPVVQTGKIALDLDVQYAVAKKGLPDRKQLRKWMKAALQTHASLAIRFVDEEEGRALNGTYRHKDYATNVLTFCYDDGPAEGPLLGDIVLCAPVVAREAAEQGKSLEAHYAHLVIHGALHLQGHDHEDEDEAEVMESIETRILSDLGYADPYADRKA